MVSSTDICNLALVEAKYDTTIESLTEESVVAKRCNRLYDKCREEVLSSYPWNFALKATEVSRLKGISDYVNIFVYPEEALRILTVYANENDYVNKKGGRAPTDCIRVRYHEGRKVIQAPYKTLYIEYVYNEKVEDNFSPLFVRVLYLTIALRLAKLAGANADDLKLLAQQLSMAEQEAKTVSAREDDNNKYDMDAEYYINVRG